MRTRATKLSSNGTRKKKRSSSEISADDEVYMKYANTAGIREKRGANLRSFRRLLSGFLRFTNNSRVNS